MLFRRRCCSGSIPKWTLERRGWVDALPLLQGFDSEESLKSQGCGMLYVAAAQSLNFALMFSSFHGRASGIPIQIHISRICCDAKVQCSMVLEPRCWPNFTFISNYKSNRENYYDYYHGQLRIKSGFWLHTVT